MKSEGDALICGCALQPQRRLTTVQRSGLQELPEADAALNPAPRAFPSWKQHWSTPGVSAGCVHPMHCQLAKPAPVPYTQILVPTC